MSQGAARIAALAIVVAASPSFADDEPPHEAPPASPIPDASPTTPPARSLEDRIHELEDQVVALRSANEQAAVDSVDVKEPVMRLYGFIDMGLQKLWATKNPYIPTNATTFVLGNIDLYFDFHPVSDWSALVETRLTNYAQGAETVGVTGLSQYRSAPSANVADPANGEGYDTVRVGSIVLERAYVQWQKHQALGIRVGQFLTPYGIWNVDHGTPTLIAIDRPEFVTDELWPAHQLGIEVFGATEDVLPAGWTLEYHGTVSNGRSPGAVDLTEGKMLGARVVASHRGLRFGASAFRSDYLRQASMLDIASGTTTSVPLVKYDEWGVGGDVSLDLGALRLRSELITRRVNYAADAHDTAYVPGFYVASGYQGDVYALAAYRIPGTRIEPYLYAEAFDTPTVLGDLRVHGSVGANYYFSPAVQLKIQATHSHWTELSDPALTGRDRQTFLTTKLTMGF